MEFLTCRRQVRTCLSASLSLSSRRVPVDSPTSQQFTPVLPPPAPHVHNAFVCSVSSVTCLPADTRLPHASSTVATWPEIVPNGAAPRNGVCRGWLWHHRVLLLGTALHARPRCCSRSCTEWSFSVKSGKWVTKRKAVWWASCAGCPCRVDCTRQRVSHTRKRAVIRFMKNASRVRECIMSLLLFVLIENDDCVTVSLILFRYDTAQMRCESDSYTSNRASSQSPM